VIRRFPNFDTTYLDVVDPISIVISDLTMHNTCFYHILFFESLQKKEGSFQFIQNVFRVCRDEIRSVHAGTRTTVRVSTVGVTTVAAVRVTSICRSSAIYFTAISSCSTCSACSTISSFSAYSTSC
jgi:hypothetical protein